MKILILFIGLLILILSCHPSVEDKAIQAENQISNLEAFAHLYGYVRYFHPSDECSAIDWNKFVYYGCKRVMQAQDSIQLKCILQSLFSPVAPSMQLYFHSLPLSQHSLNQSDIDTVMVTWQHQGLQTRPEYIYKSIRLGRDEKTLQYQQGLARELPVYKSEIDRYFRFNGLAKVSDGSMGEVSLNVYDAHGKKSTIVKDFTNQGWEEIELNHKILKNTAFAEIIITLNGNGELYFKSLKLSLENKLRKHETLWSLDVEGQKLKGSNNNLMGWYIKGDGFRYQWKKEDSISFLHVQSKPKYIPGALFERYARPDEVIEENLGRGIKCLVPLSLYLSKKSPDKYSADFHKLENLLDTLTLEENTAKLLPTRVGAVIQAWAVLKHFYPYFAEITTDWDSILPQTLAKVIRDKDENECINSLNELTAALHDGHSRVVYPGRAKLKALPIAFGYIESEIVVLASNNKHIKPGDIVVEIDGLPAKELLHERERLVSGSKQWKRHIALSTFSRNDSSLISEIKIIRNDELHSYTIDRKEPVPEFYQEEPIIEIEDGIFYVNLEKAPMREIERKIDTIAKARGVIFDLRGYPLGNHDVIRHLIDTVVLSAIWQIPQIIYPNGQKVTYHTGGRWRLQPTPPRIKGKVVFLTNSKAISYAESVMGIVEHYQLAEIVGTPTAGANGNVNSITTLGGFQFQWTGMKVLKHDSSQHHLIGIQPTVTCKPTIEGIKEGRDEVLEKALELIQLM